MKTLSSNSSIKTESLPDTSHTLELSNLDRGPTKPQVSIVIGNYNGRKYLPACLNSIRRQSFENLEVIFVDDDSRDNSAEFVAQNHSWVTVVQNVRQEKGYG